MLYHPCETYIDCSTSCFVLTFTLRWRPQCTPKHHIVKTSAYSATELRKRKVHIDLIPNKQKDRNVFDVNKIYTVLLEVCNWVHVLTAFALEVCHY